MAGYEDVFRIGDCKRLRHSHALDLNGKYVKIWQYMRIAFTTEPVVLLLRKIEF